LEKLVLLLLDLIAAKPTTTVILAARWSSGTPLDHTEAAPRVMAFVSLRHLSPVVLTLLTPRRPSLDE
jgi:hypothetical protein